MSEPHVYMHIKSADIYMDAESVSKEPSFWHRKHHGFLLVVRVVLINKCVSSFSRIKLLIRLQRKVLARIPIIRFPDIHWLH